MSRRNKNKMPELEPVPAVGGDSEEASNEEASNEEAEQAKAPAKETPKPKKPRAKRRNVTVKEAEKMAEAESSAEKLEALIVREAKRLGSGEEHSIQALLAYARRLNSIEAKKA